MYRYRYTRLTHRAVWHLISSRVCTHAQGSRGDSTFPLWLLCFSSALKLPRRIYDNPRQLRALHPTKLFHQQPKMQSERYPKFRELIAAASCTASKSKCTSPRARICLQSTSGNPINVRHNQTRLLCSAPKPQNIILFDSPCAT